MADLDYAKVNRYWNAAEPSIFGPYMMDGFGFPPSAGQFRFRAESKIVKRLIREVNHDGTVLDLGSGIGCWAEYFASEFAKIIAVEASLPLFEAMQQRCAPFSNIETIHGDVMSFEPKEQYSIVFLGGMLMYLNEGDVIDLLQKLIPFLEPKGIILSRETTVRKRIVTRQGEYQAIYRSVSTYARIFGLCGLSVAKVEVNVPYGLIQMGCELIKKWKGFVPGLFRIVPVVGRLVYWGLRLGYPWIAHVPEKLGLMFPELTNHFFVLQANTRDPSNDQGRSIVP